MPLGVHRLEKVGVGLRFAQLIEKEIHRLGKRFFVEKLPQDPDLVDVLLGDEQLLLARSGAEYVHRATKPADFSVESSADSF